MKLLKIVFFGAVLLQTGCQPEPAIKKVWSEKLKEIEKKFGFEVLETDISRYSSVFVKDAPKNGVPEFQHVVAIKNFTFKNEELDLECGFTVFELTNEKEATKLFNNMELKIGDFLKGYQIEGPCFFIQKQHTIAFLRLHNKESWETTFQIFRLIHNDKDVRISGVVIDF